MRPCGLWLGAALALAPLGAAASACAPEIDPVLGLAFDSRYAAEDASASTLIEAREEAAEAALKPLDTFIRDLARDLDAMLETPADEPVARATAAACLLTAMADWAKADALAHLETQTVRLTIGSRLAAFAIIANAAAAELDQAADLEVVQGWLAARVDEQMVFWETAPDRAGQNNLRAWAALAAAETARLTGDAVMRGWSAWSASYVLCSAAPDGSLPQEMTRGRLALHYQLHALAPLVTTVASLDQQGLPIRDRCDGALGRAVQFALSDLENGAATEAITGEVQSFFDGTDTIEPFQLAWLEAWLVLEPDAELAAVIEPMRPLRYSKLGGNQTALWAQ